VSDGANPGAIEIRRVIPGSVCQRAAGFYYAVLGLVTVKQVGCVASFCRRDRHFFWPSVLILVGLGGQMLARLDLGV